MKPRSNPCRSLLVAATTLIASSCGTVDSSVRADITRQMETARGAYATCYGAALRRNPTLQGSMVLTFRVEPTSGQFSNVAVTQDGPAHGRLRQCVVAATGRLRLSKPVPVAMSVTYPLSFAPAP